MKTIEDLIRRADKLMEKERYDEAEPLLLVALKRAPKSPEPYYLLGEVFCKQHRFAESIEILQKANHMLPNNPNILHLLGWAMFMSGNIPESRRFMELA